MADRYTELVNTPIGKTIARQIGLPAPVVLERWQPGRPVISGPVLLGAADGSQLAQPIAAVLSSIDADVSTPLAETLRAAAAAADLDAKIFNAETATDDQRFKALVFDASGISGSGELKALYDFFHPTIRRVQASGRVIVIGRTPELCEDPGARVAQRALEGFVRSIGKEVKGGSTANLVYVAPGGEQGIESTLRFLLSPRSAYVSGQVVRVAAPSDAATEAETGATVDWDAPLAGKVALVTGAARGIGKAMAETLARDGAHVIVLDVPQAAEALATVAADIGGSDLTADITDDDAPATIADHLLEHHGGVDIVVHNAGITRDKTLGRMSDTQWNLVLAINTTAIERIDAELSARGAFHPGSRIILVSSIAGIAGNFGQTNYGTSKAGVIGIVDADAETAYERGITVNAVAPGFIETQMTAAIPLAIREAGRRMNSMSQGGLPIDVAETVAWYAAPGSGGVNGNVVRVCGQSLIGA